MFEMPKTKKYIYSDIIIPPKPKIKLPNMYISSAHENIVTDVNNQKSDDMISSFSSFLKRFRILAYASELGESLRPIIPRSFVRALYGVSWGYVIIDTGFNTMMAYDVGKEAAIYTCVDRSIFHTFASMAFPAYTIHSIVRYSGRFLRFFFRGTKIARFGPTIIGIACIPYIIHPLDHLADYLMDRSCRLFYSHKLPKNLF